MNYELKAVLFDLDGVIVDTAKFHYLAWKKLADQNGIYFDEDINERLKGVSRLASLNIILEKSDKEYTDFEKEQMAEIKNNWYLEMIEQLKENDVLPGVIDFLESLKNAGIKTSICSASKSAQFIIEKLNLLDYFDTIVGGGDVKNSKPDPEVFLIASERLAISPSCCLVFEDAYAGIEAGKAAGMKTLGIGDKNLLINADVVYKDMTEVSLENIRESLY